MWLLALGLPAAGSAQEWGPPTSRGDIDRPADRPAQAAEPLFSINGSLFGGLQWIATSAVGQGSVFATGSVGLTLTVRPTESFRIFVDVGGFAGPGPDQELGTLSRVNKKADDLVGKDETVRLMKLVLRPSWLEERVLLSFGKLDVEDYFDRNVFAEDEETQFLNAALLTSPVLKAPPNGPGAALRVNVGDWRYSFGVHGLADVDGDLSGVPFIIGEIGRRNIFPRRGHYRLWARVASVQEDRGRVTWGAGVSLDQLVASDVGLFLRAAVSRDQGASLTAHAWSIGLQFTPRSLGRASDALGIGYSEQRDADGRERAAEVYYRLAAAGWFSIIANVQWIISGPNTITGGSNRNVVVPGLRTLLSF